MADVVKQFSEVLSSLQDGKGASASNLGEWEQNNKPTSKSLYRDADDSTLKRSKEVKDE